MQGTRIGADAHIEYAIIDKNATVVTLNYGENKDLIVCCGGDGTLSEVVNACAEKKNAEVAAIPLGSGNDFIRIFGEKEDLLDLKAHVTGTPMEFDLIKYEDQYAINQCSMGLDAEVCARQVKYKQ